MAVCGTREAVLRVKACRKEDESQKVSAWLGLWGSKGCRDLGMELFLSGDPPEREDKKKKKQGLQRLHLARML